VSDQPHRMSLELYERMLTQADAAVQRLGEKFSDPSHDSEARQAMADGGLQAQRRRHVAARLISAWHADVAERERNRLRMPPRDAT